MQSMAALSAAAYWLALLGAPMQTALSPLSLFLAAYVGVLALGVKWLGDGRRAMLLPALATLARAWHERP